MKKTLFLLGALALNLTLGCTSKSSENPPKDSLPKTGQVEPNTGGEQEVPPKEESLLDRSGVEWKVLENKELKAKRSKTFHRPSQMPFFIESEDGSYSSYTPSFILSADDKLIEAEVNSVISPDGSSIAFLTRNDKNQRALHIRDIRTGQVTSWNIDWPTSQDCYPCVSPEHTQLFFTDDLKRIVIRMGGQVHSDTYQGTFLAYDRLSAKLAWKTIKQSVRPQVHLHNMQYVLGAGRDHLFFTTSESLDPKKASLHALDMNSGELKLVSPDAIDIKTVHLSSDGGKVAVQSEKTIDIFDSESLRQITQVKCENCFATVFAPTITLSPDFTFYIKSRSGNSPFEARETSTGRILWRLVDLDSSVVPSSNYISRNGKFIGLRHESSVDGYRRYRVSILNGETGKIIGTVKEPYDSKSGYLSREILYISNDGKTVVTSYELGSTDYGIGIFKPAPGDKPCAFNSLSEKTLALNRYFENYNSNSNGMCEISKKYSNGFSDHKTEFWNGKIGIQFNLDMNKAGPYLTDSGKIGINCGNGAIIPAAGSIDLMCNSEGEIVSAVGHYSNLKCSTPKNEYSYDFSTSRRDGKKAFYRYSSKQTFSDGTYDSLDKSCQ